MAISLRNKDSVTGIVLYIFNLLRQYKDMDEEIELSDLLKYLKAFNKSESAARMGLSRMTRSGIIMKYKKNGNIFYKLDKEGKSDLKIWSRGYKYFNLKYDNRQTKEWNNNWSSYILKDFNKSDKENEIIIEHLIELGLCEIEYNVWLSAYNISNIVEPLLKDHKISFFNIDGDLKTDLNLTSYIYEIYNFKSLEKKYENLKKMIDKNYKVIKNKNTKSIDLLPMLGYTGWLFYSIITEDPFLPKKVMTNWIGDSMVEEFNDFKEKVFSRIIEELFKNRLID